MEAGKQINKLREHPNVQGWLYVVARSLIYGSLREIYKKKKYEINVDYMEFDIEDESDFSLEELFDYQVDIEELCSKVLENLDAGEYELYVDYYKNKIPAARLSEKYNISKTALTTRAYRLKKFLKNLCDYLQLLQCI